MKIKILKFALAFLLLIILVGIIIFTLVWNGVIILNDFSAKKYAVKGIDVSSYQGDIDWAQLLNEDLSFVYIKATEGSSFVDKKFAYNYEQAQNNGFNVGAYHFFSFDSFGETQAENFIKNVQPFDGMLPPVIDIEFYGDKERNPPARADVEKNLKTVLEKLEQHYGLKPIIYATEKSYELYLSHDYEEYDIWIRNVISKPKLCDNRNWVFWQYTNREKLSGYNGDEEFIDMNVFDGSIQEFDEYLIRNTYQTN